jgi:ATP-dependent helicase HrpA
MADVVRYLRAARARLEKLPTAPRRDAELMETVHEVAGRYRARRAAAADDPRTFDREAWDAVGWMIEELRVSSFAQEIGTAGSVSVQRIDKASAKL